MVNGTLVATIGVFLLGVVPVKVEELHISVLRSGQQKGVVRSDGTTIKAIRPCTGINYTVGKLWPSVSQLLEKVA